MGWHHVDGDHMRRLVTFAVFFGAHRDLSSEHGIELYRNDGCKWTAWRFDWRGLVSVVCVLRPKQQSEAGGKQLLCSEVLKLVSC